jgi:hypothetical protein
VRHLFLHQHLLWLRKFLPIGLALDMLLTTHKLYAYTPEVLPSAHRATGYGIAIGCNRIMGLISAFVATYANTNTDAPVYLCAALYIAMVRFPS